MLELDEMLVATEVSRSKVSKLEAKFPDITFPELGHFTELSSTHGLSELKNIIKKYLSEKKTTSVNLVLSAIDEIDKTITNAMKGRTLDVELVQSINNKELLTKFNEQRLNLETCKYTSLALLLKEDFEIFEQIISTREGELLSKNIEEPGTDIDKALNILQIQNIMGVISQAVTGNTAISRLYEDAVKERTITRSNQLIEKLTPVYNNKKFIKSALKAVIINMTKSKSE